MGKKGNVLKFELAEIFHPKSFCVQNLKMRSIFKNLYHHPKRAKWAKCQHFVVSRILLILTNQITRFCNSDFAADYISVVCKW